MGVKLVNLDETERVVSAVISSNDLMTEDYE
jgi:hypothetical protein